MPKLKCEPTPLPAKTNRLPCDKPLTRQDLVNYFMEGCKEESDLMVGVEWEKIGVYEDTGKAICYSGPRGVEGIFDALIDRYGWQPVYSEGHAIALTKGDCSITLEPGGQIELSGRKARTLDENATELFHHLSEIKTVSKALGIRWLGLGLQPMSRLDEIEWVPKHRYAIMRESLKNKGALTYSMMKQTASIQISLDYTSEADAAQKLRLAIGLAPVLSALFANSPVSEGRLNGFASKRCDIWSKTDPARTGLIKGVFNEAFGFADYVRYALRVPALFIVREGKWIALNGMPFGEFMEKGSGRGHRATLTDWELHLTTIFTDARLKKYIEMRSVDCQKTALGLSVPALLKGLFYHDSARKSAWRLVAGASFEERVELSRLAALKGLEAKWKGRSLLELARKLFKLAEEGLGREADYLIPLKEILFEYGKSPAELFREQFRENEPQENKVRRIIEWAAI